MVASSTGNGQQPEHRRSKKSILCIIAGVLIIIWFAFDLSGLGDNIRFYHKWAECDTKPVSTKGSGFMNSGAKHYYESPTIAFMRASIDYYCTPLEAEQAGYSASPNYYEFPNLKSKR